MVNIINMKVKLMEVDEEILEEEEVEEVVEVVVEIIEVNNQIATKIATIAGNLGTWQRIVIKGNYASTNNQGDEQLFVMQHMANSMIGGVSNNNVWYVDSGVSNHMTSHEEWFRDQGFEDTRVCGNR